MTNSSSIGAQGFISYARRDNEDFTNVVDRLKAELEGRFHAATGRRLEIFLDRESIGWGADWRAKIRDSVRSATFFIPIVTMRYFDSAKCREELLAFYQNANQLGVTDLILPLILAGADEINEDDPRDEVRLIESLNYKNIEDAWLAGYESPDWLRAVHGMVAGLKQNLAGVESALASQESEIKVTTSGAAVEATESEADVSALGNDIRELTAVTQELASGIVQFGDAAKASMGGVDMKALPPQQQQIALIRVAKALKEPSEKLATVGSSFEKGVTRTDARLRAVVEEMRSIDIDMAQAQLDSLLDAFAGIDQLSATVGQMNGMVQMLRLAAITNVSLRKSVQPAIQGLQAISNGIATVESWRAI